LVYKPQLLLLVVVQDLQLQIQNLIMEQVGQREMILIMLDLIWLQLELKQLGLYFQETLIALSTETYDGTSYTEVGDLNTARQKPAGFGAQPSAICAGGEGPPGAQAVVESWNGTSWTEVGDLNTARFGLAAAIQAPSTNGIVFGGYITNDSALAETWNGSVLD
jgi:hypothetical protein